jgi:DNA-binding beta-propeller fold protein YncE
MGAVASHVYGQSDVYKTLEPTSATSLNYTAGLAIADGMVVVCSSNDNRVMVFPPGPPVSNDIAAIRVLGQPDFASHGSGSTLSRMSLPYDVAYDSVANTLWVVDTFNSRVLSFSNSIVRVLQNLTSLDVIITFQGQQPTVFVYPKGLFEKRDLPFLKP